MIGAKFFWRSSGWILASSAAWGLAGGLFCVAVADAYTDTPFFLPLALSGLLFGLPTGIAMQFLLAEDNIKPEYRVNAPAAASAEAANGTT